MDKPENAQEPAATEEENEGEGSRSAARRYVEGVERTVKGGHVTEEAEKAEREVEANPEEYREAEEQGRDRSAGEAPGEGR